MEELEGKMQGVGEMIAIILYDKYISGEKDFVVPFQLKKEIHKRIGTENMLKTLTAMLFITANKYYPEYKDEFDKKTIITVDQHCKTDPAYAEYKISFYNKSIHQEELKKSGLKLCSICDDYKPIVDFKRCSCCRNASYCSAECQKTDWKKHKKICSPSN